MTGLQQRIKSWSRWHLQAFWDRLGTPELILIALIALAMGLYGHILHPLQQQQQALETRIAALQQQSRSTVKQAGAGQTPTAIQLSPRDRFLAFLPDDTRREALLKQIHTIAQSQQVQLDKIQYNPEPFKDLPVQARIIRLDAQGTPEALRRYVHLLLDTIPSLALRRLEFHQDVQTAATGLTLEAVLYLRNDTEAAHASE